MGMHYACGYVAYGSAVLRRSRKAGFGYVILAAGKSSHPQEGRNGIAAAAKRRSDRVSLTLLLEASGKDSQGQEFKEPARTLLINRTGAVIVFPRELTPEQTIHLKRQAPMESHRETDVRVVNQFGHQRDGYLYGIEIEDPSKDLWGVEFPPVAESTEAVARMLLECNYCRSREVAYLNELELRAFETNRGIARHCKICRVPSIWTQAPHEDEKKLNARAARGKRTSETADERAGRGRAARTPADAAEDAADRLHPAAGRR